MSDIFDDPTIQRRKQATSKLIKALSHIDHERQIEIICAWMPLDRLEEMANFQAERTG